MWLQANGSTGASCLSDRGCLWLVWAEMRAS